MRLAVVTMLALLGSELGAQQMQTHAAALDSIVARHRVTTARRKALDDSVARSRQSLDSVRVGPVTIFVASDHRALGDETARLVADSLRTVDPGLLARAGTLRFVVRRVAPPRWVSPSERPTTITILDSVGTEAPPFWEMNGSATVMAGYVADHVRRRLASLVRPPLATWVGAGMTHPPIRFDTVGAFEWSQLRLDLASAISIVSRRCFDGSLPDCRHVLGLDSVAAPVRQYYDSAGRRALVLRSPEQFRRRERALTEACLEGADASCTQLLEHGFADLSLASIGQRVALLQRAIEIGGPGAAVRAISASGSPSQQLATIAGMSTDSLIADWRRQLLTRRVPSDNMTPGMTVSSLAWVGLLGFLALRNRRWR